MTVQSKYTLNLRGTLMGYLSSVWVSIEQLGMVSGIVYIFLVSSFRSDAYKNVSDAKTQSDRLC